MKANLIYYQFLKFQNLYRSIINCDVIIQAGKEYDQTFRSYIL